MTVALAALFPGPRVVPVGGSGRRSRRRPALDRLTPVWPRVLPSTAGSPSVRPGGAAFPVRVRRRSASMFSQPAAHPDGIDLLALRVPEVGNVLGHRPLGMLGLGLAERSASR